jgi:methylated-DNA-[protein]-cysteine S-methyltransferase
MTVTTLIRELFETPTGAIVLVTDEAGRVRLLDWSDNDVRIERLLRRHCSDASSGDGVRSIDAARATPARRALEAYFEGELDAVAELSTVTQGTEFQRAVWDALRRIPTGTTMTYQAIAADIGRPTATRAVGMANGSNPIAIVVPCHRVIGADASLTGFAGGIERKRWLLAHEDARPVAYDPWRQRVLAGIDLGGHL